MTVNMLVSGVTPASPAKSFVLAKFLRSADVMSKNKKITWNKTLVSSCRERNLRKNTASSLPLGLTACKKTKLSFKVGVLLL